MGQIDVQSNSMATIAKTKYDYGRLTGLSPQIRKGIWISKHPIECINATRKDRTGERTKKRTKKHRSDEATVLSGVRSHQQPRKKLCRPILLSPSISDRLCQQFSISLTMLIATLSRRTPVSVKEFRCFHRKIRWI